MTIAHVNRMKSRAPKRTTHYCYGCDRALVSTGIKCPVCGYVNGKRRLKHAPTQTEGREQ